MTTRTTITITESPTQSVFFHLASRDLPKAEPTRFSISRGLGAILIKYGKEQDILSKNLMAAGHTFLVYAVENYTRPLDAVLRGSIEKIEGIKKALKNLHEPWLVDGVVTLDKRALDEYEGYRKRFSGRPIEAVPHRFGQEVLGWIDELPMALNSPGPLLQITSQSTQPCLPKDVRDYQRYLQYEGMIEAAHERKKKEAELQRTLVRVKQLEIAKEILEVANTQGFQGFRQDLARQEESQQQQNAEFKRGLVSLQTQQQETVTLYQEADEVTNAALRHVKGDLEAANIKITRLEAESHYLYGQIYSCQGQLGQLQNDLNDAKSGCSLM
jgi:hypothetical protein